MPVECFGQHLSIEECAQWPQVGESFGWFVGWLVSWSNGQMVEWLFVGFHLGVKRASCNMLRLLGQRKRGAGGNDRDSGWSGSERSGHGS